MPPLRSTLRAASIALAIAPLDAAAALGQGFVEHVAPPVAERGKTTRVTFVGRDLAPALDVWDHSDGGLLRSVLVESGPEKAVFDIRVAEAAPVGLRGLRLATRDGLTNAHLFLIDDLPVKSGVQAEEAVAVSLPATVWGTLRAATADRYTIEVEAGQCLSIEAVASRFGKDADPLVTIRDEAGKFVAERDNDPGLFFDCRFERIFPKAGRYTVEVRDARFHGNEHRLYALRLGRFPAARVAVPSAVCRGGNELRLPEVGGPELPFVHSGPLHGPFSASLKREGDNGSSWLPLLAVEGGPITVARESKEPTEAQSPGILCGLLKVPGISQTFSLKLEKGQRLFVRGEARSLNSPAELELIVADRTVKELRRSTEVRGSDDVSLEFAAPAAGDYRIVVREALRDGGTAFAYRVAVRNHPFPPQLAAEVEGLTVPQGSFQSFPIVVTSGDGVKGITRLKLHGAPPGLKLTPTEIGEKETALHCRLEADASVPVGLYRFQLLAETDGPGGPSRFLVRTQPLVDRRIVNVDLVPHALREDQRRLPPSMTDRFALQVTPPAPFDFELPEAVLTLPRYKRVDVPLRTARRPGFDGPITFTAKGGQLAAKDEGRTRVFAEFPIATPKEARLAGYVQSKILSNLGRARIDVSAAGTQLGRRVTLTRSFDLEIVPAFKVVAEPANLSLLPGESGRVRLRADRGVGFEGAVTVKLPSLSGVTLPEEATIAEGQDGIDIEVKAAADGPPRRHVVNVTAHGDVGEFEEEVRATPFEIEVRKPDAPKKK